MTYTATPRDGAGKAAVMHERRGAAIADAVGVDVVPGTLNVMLNRPFDWAGAKVVPMPDAVSWSALDGPWLTSTARIKRVEVGGVEAWALRMERSRAPDRLLELVAPVRLRDAITSWPAPLEVS